MVVVTGASDGIGYICAQQLAAMGAQIVLVGRDDGKCSDAVVALQNTTGNTNISFEIADLSLLHDVRALAQRLLDSHAHIDVLLNNAGGYFQQSSLTLEGLEHTFALNHMAYFLLTDLLLQIGRASCRERV